VILVFAGSAAAAVPATMSYQGLLKDSSGLAIPDGTYSLTFRLYGQSSGGAPLWNETQALTVRDGLFSAVLGSVTPLTPAFDATYWIPLQDHRTGRSARERHGLVPGPGRGGAGLAPRTPALPSRLSERALSSDGAIPVVPISVGCRRGSRAAIKDRCVLQEWS
jgi:hypothetical protein